MSHFCHLVLIDGDVKNVESHVEHLLEAYSENLEVDEYDRECYCINEIARRDAFLNAQEEAGFTVNEKRDEYWALPEAEREKVSWEEMIKPIKEAEETFLAKNPDKDKPNPDCETCDGTGTYRSTYNPQSRWDWWVIGGRWDGYLWGPEVQEGRQTEGGFNFADENHLIENNMRSVKDLMGVDFDYSPYSVSLPDGTWVTKGDMGWWGMDSNAKDQNDWDAQVEHIFAQHKECRAVCVDCHI